MGGRLKSYLDMGGGGKADWLDSWKESGSLIAWLHREPPFTRTVHNFRRIVKDGDKTLLSWLPFVCWESDEWHRQCRFNKGNPPSPKAGCPIDFLLQHLAARSDLADDAAIFEFRAGREVRTMYKIDILGKGKARDSFKDDLTPKEEFILAVMPSKDTSKFRLTNEKWSVGRALVSRIQNDIKNLGEDVGDPSRRPICYGFEIDKSQSPHRYGVTRIPEVVLTPQIQKLWSESGPDASRYVEPSNPKILLEAMKASLVVDLPLDQFFATALESWARTHPHGDDDNEEEDPSEVAPPSEEKTAAKSAPTSESRKSTPSTETAKTKTRTAGKPKETPPPPPAVTGGSSICGACGIQWPDSQPRCPGCGAEEEEPPMPTTTTNKAR